MHTRPIGALAARRTDSVFRLPIVWLALALFVATIAGCIVTIMIAVAQPDAALPDVGERLLNVPTAHTETER